MAPFLVASLIASVVDTSATKPSRTRSRARAAHMDVCLTHIGGPTVLIEVGGWRLLTDPTFDPPGRWYYFGRGTGSRKTAGPALAASELGPIDAVLLTHDHHADNLDAAGRAVLQSAGVVITTVSGAKRLGGETRGLEPWATTRLGAPRRPPIEVTATPCRHGPPLSRPLAGDVIGFALRWDGQEHGVLWISGDTVLYDGVRQVADRLQVGTALLHLGGVRFPISGPVRYTMSAKEAVELCRLVQPRTVIPIHYEGWKHFREGREAIERELANAPEDVRGRVRWLPIGVATGLAV
jgi:L-ascorbate metabolism protein UlaG (beta-lactamase superfamily)